MAEKRVQRKLAAIFAADVVGYSRLMEVDEEGTLTRMQALRKDVIDPKTAEFGGRIFKTTGDGILAEFPSAVDAVRHAVDVQRAMIGLNADEPPESRIIFRIGISLGDVMVDGDDLFGNGVNVASRMEGLADPGGICISGNVQEHVGNSLDVPLEDLGEQTVKNIDRPVRCYRVYLEQHVQQPGASAQLPDRPSIAVLPFDNLSGDTEQEYFSDGMAEDLITDLSKLPNIFVAARNSSFAFKGQMPDVRDVSEKLGVRFVLECSVRKMADRLRINAQLIDATDGGHVWAERYDGAMSEIFDFQDRITNEIISALEIKLSSPAGTERRRTHSVEAYDNYLNGRRHYYQYTPESFAEAFRCFEKAVELDPTFADAYSYLSGCHVATFVLRCVNIDEELVQALTAAEKAVSLDPNSALAHSRLGWVHTWRRRYEEAERAFKKAEALGPELVEAFAYHGISQAYAGNPERGLELTTKALELDPFAPTTDYHLGVEYLLLDRYEEAIEKLEMARNRTPRQINMRLQLASAYVKAERMKEANGEIEKVLELTPEYTLALADRIFPHRLGDVRRRFLESLRNAGLPEKSPESGEALPLPDNAPALNDRASIAVLPFANMSGDPEQEYFSDGIGEDIITALSRARWFRVVSRNSTFAYKGTSTDVRQVAKELDVRYVLEGSVRKTGNRVRVTAQLIDAPTDNHLWAERYDRELEDIFDVQDDITAAIVVQIEPELRRAELNRATIARPESLNVWDVYQRGWWHMYRKDDPDNQAALDHFCRAAELDPNFGPAHSGIAQACGYLVWFDRVDDRESYNDQGMRAARRAVELDSEDPAARFSLGIQHATRGDYQEALAEYEHALRLNPFSAEARQGIGRALVDLGRFSEAVTAMEEGIRLCPNDQLTGILMARLAEAKFHLHEYDEAVDWSRQATRQPVAPRMWGQVTLVAALGQANDADGARQVFQNILKQRPNFSLAYVREHYPIKIPEAVEHLVDGLRKAGVPE